MCRLLESLKIQDGQVCNVEYHQERILRSGSELYGLSKAFDLENVIQAPENYQNGLVKCRVIYTDRIHTIEFHPYQKRTVNSIKIVRDETIDYSHKYENRQKLEELYGFRGGCDEILVIKNGWVTDAFASNVAFFKDDIWYTPATPLLKGTKRAQLLRSGQLIEKEISEKDIKYYDKISLINAMVELGDIEVFTTHVC
jgi:4-amino-4-deoxychorismate lyase